MKTVVLRQNSNELLEQSLKDHQRGDGAERRFPPASVDSQLHGLTASPLRMYTEEEVAGILQVSLSQLRKWRMKQNETQQGPPFKKVGRLVRYPQRALQAYIDGD